MPDGETLSRKAALVVLQGADTNATRNFDHSQHTPLFDACSGGIRMGARAPVSQWRAGEDTMLVQLLLTAKADPNLKVIQALGQETNSPLCRVCELGISPHLVKILADGGADLEIRCGDATGGQFTPLIIAAQNCHAQVLLELLSLGADVNAQRSVTGLTALHALCEMNQPLLITALVDAGADLELRKYPTSSNASQEQTAFQIAAGRGSWACVKVLIEAGADTDATFMYRGQRWTALQDAFDEVQTGRTPASGCDWYPKLAQFSEQLTTVKDCTVCKTVFATPGENASS